MIQLFFILTGVIFWLLIIALLSYLFVSDLRYRIKEHKTFKKAMKQLVEQEKQIMFSSQLHWKPKEEHIKAIRWVMQNIPNNIHKENLNGLLEELQKL